MEFLPKIIDFVDEYLKKFSVLGQEKLLIYDTKAKKIPVGGGFHSWHYENTGLQVSARKLVIQLYLFFALTIFIFLILNFFIANYYPEILPKLKLYICLFQSVDYLYVCE